MRYHRWKLCFAAPIALIFPSLSHADTVISNLGATTNGAGTVYGSGPSQTYAQEFLTGPQSLNLVSITAPLGGAVVAFTLSAELVDGVGGLPGSTVLATFTPSAQPGTGFADIVFDPNAPLTLAAGTDYYFVLWATGTGSYKWDYTDTLSTSFPNYAVSEGGAPFTIGAPPGPFQIAVDESAVTPEPPSFILLASAGLLGLAVAFRGSKTRMA